MKRKSIINLFLAAALAASMLTGCGGTADKTPEGAGGSGQTGTSSDPAQESGAGEAAEGSGGNTASGDSNAAQESGSSDTAGGALAASAGIDSPDSSIGEWSYMCTISTSEDDESSYEYVTMYGDDMCPEASVKIRKDGDKYLADYKFQEYEYNAMIYGGELKYSDGAPYADAGDRKWHFKMEDPFADEDDNATREYMFSMKDEDTLEVAVEYTSAPDDEYKYHSVSKNLFLRKDSPAFENIEELRYFDTVTVSTTEDLLNSIKNNRKIIVEAGTYNFTTCDRKKISNSLITDNYGTLSVDGVSNLGIEAADGADVQFCIDEPYDPVLSFNNGGNITLRGITCGHTVEPGYCSGSVLYFSSMAGVDIDKCKLYGSGTYGVEAMYASRINVRNTDIYECTYGLVSLTNCSVASFNNCTMRDSSDLSMIYINSTYDVVFDNCTFSNNRADAYDSCYFVELGEYDRATFRNCVFNNNKFNAFSNKEVTMENCTSDNNQAGFSDILKAYSSGAVPDKKAIQDAYDAAKKRQEEIDNKFQNDTLMDQQTMNQLAYEEYTLWDGLINAIWTYLNDNLEEDKMTALTEEQQKWIRDKEASMKSAGADFEGGSMQPMIEYGTGASLTQKRVEELMNQYVHN